MKKILPICLIFLISSLFSTNLTVKKDGTGDYNSIQMAIDEANSFDSLIVYPGTYYENINFNGKNVSVGSLVMIGYDISYRDSTIIDGDHNGTVVVFENNETPNCHLNGFTIQNGLTDRAGGGIYIKEASPTLENLKVVNNLAQNIGGINLLGSHSHLENIIIKNNVALSFGGGIGLIHVKNLDTVDFDSTNRVSIFDNIAAEGSDIFINNGFDLPIYDTLYVDTLSVLNPDGNFFCCQFTPGNVTINALHYTIEQVDTDLYVDPELGDNQNSGLTENQPLKTIQNALSRLVSESDHVRHIHLAPGIYSKDTNGEYYGLNLRSNICFDGSGIDQTIIDGSNFFFFAFYGYYPDTEYLGINNLTIRNFAYHLFTSATICTRFSKLNINNCKFVNNSSDMATVANMNHTATISMENLNFYNNHSYCLLDFDYAKKVNLNNFIAIKNYPVVKPFYYEMSNGSTAITSWKSKDVNISNALIGNNYGLLSYENPVLFFIDPNTINVINTTIYKNYPSKHLLSIAGGGKFNFFNCIIHEQDPDITMLYLIPDDRYSSVNFDHCLITGGTNASIQYGWFNGGNAPSDSLYPEVFFHEGILDGDPMLKAQSDDPLQLGYYVPKPNSPCIDAGTLDLPAGFNLPQTDLAGNPRIHGNNIDIGAYEWQPFANNSNEEVTPIPKSEIKNYPNPFSISGGSRQIGTTIKLILAQAGNIELGIYNIKGQKVKTLLKIYSEKGEYQDFWDGTNDNDKHVSSGNYFIKLSVNGEVQAVKKCLLMK